MEFAYLTISEANGMAMCSRQTHNPKVMKLSLCKHYVILFLLTSSSEGDCTFAVCYIQCQSKKRLLQVEGSCRLVSKRGCHCVGKD